MAHQNPNPSPSPDLGPAPATSSRPRAGRVAGGPLRRARGSRRGSRERRRERRSSCRRGGSTSLVPSAACSGGQTGVVSVAETALRAGEAPALVVARLDRLARSLSDAARLLERAEREGWNLSRSTSGSTSRRRRGSESRTSSRQSLGGSGACSPSARAKRSRADARRE